MVFHQTSTRAGRYIKQPTGYEAFIPCPLPPRPAIKLDDVLLDVLSKADRAIGRLDGCTETLPDSDLFVFMYMRKEAVLSSQIEGTQASLMDVLEYEATSRDGQSHDVGDVFNYVTAMSYGLKRLRTLPLSLRLIKEIHEKLVVGSRGSHEAGEFRRSQNWIGPQGSQLKDALFIPPPVHEMQVALGDLEKFLHDKAPMPYLIRAGIAHAQFETIHPFVDGNGRLGRLLITFMLCEQKFMRRPLLYLSFFLKKNRAEYYDRLQAVRTSGQWEQWLKFFLKGVAEVAEEATATARKIARLREVHRRMVADKMGRAVSRGLKLLESLYRQPVVSVSMIAEVSGLSFQGAADLARHFVSLGILSETTGRKRHRLFAYRKYLALLGETKRPKKSAASTSGARGLAVRSVA